MKFGQALEALLNGRSISRAAWNQNLGGIIMLGLQPPTGKITQPFLYQQRANGECTIYTPVQSDLLAEDWILASPEKMAVAAAGQANVETTGQTQTVGELAHAGA